MWLRRMKLHTCAPGPLRCARKRNADLLGVISTSDQSEDCEGGPRFGLPGKKTVTADASAGASKPAAWRAIAEFRSIEGAANDCGPLTPGTACERKGQSPRTRGLPLRSAASFFAVRREHMCAPFFLQQAGRSFWERSSASAGSRGPAPNRTTSRKAMARRKVQSDYCKLPARARKLFRLRICNVARESAAAAGLLVAEGGEGVGAHGAAGGKIAGEERDDGHEESDGEVGEGVRGSDAVEFAGENAG